MSKASQRVKDNSRVLNKARVLLRIGPGKMRDVAEAAAKEMHVFLPKDSRAACWALLHEFVASRTPAQHAAAAERSPREKAERAWKGKRHAHGPRHPDVNSDAFLLSYEWRSLRMLVLTKWGPRCQCCGATPKDGVRIHVDHIKPRRLFPELALVESNLQVLCEACNHGKGNWDQTDWRQVEPVDLPENWHVPMWGSIKPVH